MGQPQKRKKMHSGDTHLRRRWRTRSRHRDMDEIDKDLQTNTENLMNQEVDFDKPGFAQFYCLHCAKYFIDDHSMQAHFKTKVHKRRLKNLEIEPYTMEEAERAAGHGSFVNPKKRKMETQPTKEEWKNGKRIKIEFKEEEIKEMNKME